VKQIQIAALTPKTVRDALKGADQDIVVFDGDEPLLRLVSIAAEMKHRKDFFLFYPHDAAECFHTCWSHDGSAEREQQEQQKADAEPVPADA